MIKVPFSYLQSQFSHPEPILRDIARVVRKGDFTLGKETGEFEKQFAKVCQTRYAVGVNSGTDAIFLCLKALGIGNGDEVITVPNTFIATVGAIVASGAKPVFVDCNEEYLINPDLIEQAITSRTKAIIPVHYAGCPADLTKILSIAKKHNLYVLEDACQSINATLNKKKTGSFGIAGCFSLHPLKNVNVWGDAGIITTSSKPLYEKLKLLQNHGLKNRDEISVFGYNSRMDTLQAIVGLHVLKQLGTITKNKIRTAALYDQALPTIPEITLPPRRKNAVNVYHLYIVQAENRDALLAHLIKNGIEAKIHYPIPLHLQKCSKNLGYKKGDFPMAEQQAKHYITLPGHQYLTDKQIQYTIQKIKSFYKGH